MKRPWLAVGTYKQNGDRPLEIKGTPFVNIGLSEKTLDHMGSLVYRGRTLTGFAFAEIAAVLVATGFLVKVALPFAQSLLGF